MKKILISAVLGLTSITLASAATSEDAVTNEVSGVSTVTFSNSAGQVFSAARFADNLKNLRSAIEQTMPMVAAVTESHTNQAKASNQDKSLTGKVSDFVSGAIKRDGTQNSNQNQNASASSKVMDALRGLLKTNSNNSVTASSTDQATVQNLSKLEGQLKNILPTLDHLNVTASGGGATDNAVLTPTGR